MRVYSQLVHFAIYFLAPLVKKVNTIQVVKFMPMPLATPWVIRYCVKVARQEEDQRIVSIEAFLGKDITWPNMLTPSVVRQVL